MQSAASSNVPLGTRFLVTLAALCVVMAGLKLAEPLLVPLIFAAFLAILTAPAMLWLKERGVPEVIGIPALMIVVFIVLTIFGGIVGTSIKTFMERLPEYQDSLNQRLGSVLEHLERLGMSVEGVRQAVDPGALLKVAGGLVGQLASAVSNALLVVLTLVFMLFEVSAAPAKLRHALGDPKADLAQFTAIAGEVKLYIVIKTNMSLLTGVAVGLILWVLGVDFPVLWGLIAFALNYVPNIGSIIAAVPPVLLATVQFGGGSALLVALGFVVVNTVVGNILEPRYMGERLGLSTLVVFLSLVVWGWLWGAVGMLLSVPLTMIVKIMLEHSGQFRAIAVLMGSKPPESAT